MDYQKVGQRIQWIRQERGLTQEKLAEAAGRSVSYISRIECGWKKPSLETLLRISAALDVTVDTLLGHEQTLEQTICCAEVQALLDGCSPAQCRLLYDIFTAIKAVLLRHNLAA